MNPEKLHDALNQLPDDLIAAADALRQKEQHPIVWKRMLPVAACFVLVLGALYVTLPLLTPKGAAENAAPMEMMQDSMSQMELAGVPETAAPAESPAAGAPREEPEAAPEMEGVPLAPDTEEQAGNSTSSMTEVTCRTYCIGSEEPDETMVTVISTLGEWERYLADNPRLTEEGGFENAYDIAYFEKNQLIVVVTAAASSSVRYEINGILKTGTSTWELKGTQLSPEWFTDDMEQQCILVELPRMVEPEDTVTVNLTTVPEP